MNNNLILLYIGNNHEKGKQIKQLLENTYAIRILQDEELHQSLGFLVGLDAFEPNLESETNRFDFEMMVLPVMEQAEIQALIKTLKEKDLDVARKAMLTEHNQHWSIADLMKEIDEEHTYFMKRDQLNQLFIAATKLDPSRIDAQLAPAFQQAVLLAYDTLQNQNSMTNDFETAWDSLLPLYEKSK